jgi:O-antigen/teichoic acid export membrane protein
MIKKAYKTHRETIHNFFWRALQIIGKDGVVFLIFLISARLLIPYEFGVYNYVLAVIFFLIIFGDFGISTATSKYVAEYNATNKKKLKLVLFNSGIIILGLTILITILTLLFGKFFLGDKYVYVLYLLPLIFLAPMTSLYDGIYRGLKQFKKLAIISLIVGLISLSFVYILIKSYGLVGALIAQNIFYLILLVSLSFGYKEFHFKFNNSVAKSLLKYSIIIGVINISYFLYSRFDTIILGQFGLIVQIGYYELVNKFIALIMIPLMILAQIDAPNIVKAYYKPGKSFVLDKLIKRIKYSIIFSVIISVVSLMIIPLIIKIILPEYYNSNVLFILYILLFVFIFQSVASFIGNSFIVSTGHARLNMVVLVVFGVINVILDILFVSHFGYMGIAYSKLVIGVVGNIVLLAWYYKTMKCQIQNN